MTLNIAKMKQLAHLHIISNLRALNAHFLRTLLFLLLFSSLSSEVWAYWTTDKDGNALTDNASIEGYVKYTDGVYYVVYDDSEHSFSVAAFGGSYTSLLNGPGAQLTYKAKRTYMGTGNMVVTDGYTNLYNGNPGKEVKNFLGITKAIDYESYGAYGINVNSKGIRFHGAGGTLDKHVNNIHVTMASYFVLSRTSIAFGAADINTANVSDTLKIHWSNTAAKTITKSGDTDRFIVSTTSIPSKAGYYGNTVITVTYKHDVAGSHSMTLKVNDQTITVTGTTNKLQPTITWSSNDDFFNVEDVLGATNANDLTVTLSGNSMYVTCVDNTATMKAATTGTITITAHVTGNEIYANKDFTKDITITNLTKQYITWNQDFSRLKTTDASKSIVLNATASSGLAVSYELSGDKTGLSLTQSGNTWTLTYSAVECKNTTIVAKQGGDGITYAPASSVSLPVKVIDPAKVCDTDETLVNSTITMINQSASYNIDIPSTMTIQVSRTKTGLFDWYLNGFKVEFYAGRNGTGSKLHEFSYGAGDINNSKTISLTDLNIAAKSVKLISEASNGYDVTSVTYTHQKYCTTDSTSLNFKTYPNTTTSEKTFTVNYANYPIILECANNKFTFSPSEFGDCSEYGTQTVSVTYTAGADEGSDVGYLHIKDNTGVTLRTCTLNVSISRLTQSITSTNIQASYKTTDRVVLAAEANSKLTDFEYAATPSGIASFAGNVMTFSQSGTIAITATQPGSNVYASTYKTVSDVVIKKDTPTIATNPTVATIHYLDTLANSQLSEGLATVTLRGVANSPVAGTFEWTNNGAQVTNNGGEYSITFKPTNTGMYTIKVFNQTIAITRADAFINMNNGSVRVAVDGIDAGKADSYLNLNTLIASQTTDAIEANRAGAVSYEVISDNKANATIDGSTFSATVCGSYTICAIKAQTAYYVEARDTFTVAVNKRANTLTTAEAYTQYVEDSIPNVRTDVNSDGLIHTHSTDPSIAYYDIEKNKIYIPNSEAKSFDQTTVTITIWQDATARFEAIPEAKAKTITLTIKKYNNAFACSWNSWEKTIGFEESVAAEFTTKNTDYSNSPIQISQTSGSKVATLVRNDATHNTITASYNVDDAIWHLSQAESYKYKAAEKDVTVKVRTKASPDCEITLYENPTASVASVTSTGDMGGEGVKLYFEMKNTDAGINAKLYTSADGNNWTEQPSVTYNAFDLNEDGYDEKEVPLPAHTRYIKFAKGGIIGTDDPVIRNIRVTADKWFNLENNAGEEISSITMPTNTLGGYHTTETFVVNYSTCADTIKVVSNHPHITVSADDAKFFSNGHGKKTITVTYASNETEIIDAVITVYTPHENKTLAVHAETEKKDQVITWNEGFTESTLTLPVGLSTNNAASATLYPVKYRTNNKDVIRIYNDSTGFEIIGTTAVPVTLTAYQKGDDEYKYVEDTKYVLASDKKIQVISWTQDFTRLTTESPVQDLEAKVMLMNVATGDLTYSAARTDSMKYSLKHAGVVALDGKTLTVLNEGTDTIVATIAGDEEYEAARVELAVKVKIPSVGCEDQPLTWSYEGGDTYIKDEEIQLFLLSLTKPELAKIIRINPGTGVPGTLTFQEKGTEYAKAFFKGEIEVRESETGTDWNTQPVIWHGTPQVGSYTSHTVSLQPNTRYVRFSRPAGGEGYHHIANIAIDPAQFIEADDVDFGEMEAGDIVTRNVAVRFSNVKGDISVSSSSPHVAVASTITADCGSFGSRDLAITCSPMEKGDFSADVTLSEPLSGLTKTIHVTAHVNTGSQSITWEPQEMSFMVSEENDLNAALPKKTNKGQNVSYASNNESVITISGNRAVIVNPGEATITVSQPGDGVNFSAATPLLINVTITQETLTLTDLSASAIIYGQALSSSTISGVATDTKGNTVDGTFTWADGTELLSVGTHVRTVVFTPSENVAWYIVGTTSASVQVVKADPNVTPQASDIEFGHYVKESTLSTASGTVAGTWYWHSNDKNDKLSVGTHTLYVDFVPQNDALYNSLTDVPVSLTVITATHYIFDGPSDNWDTPANWNTGMLPDKDKDVIINSNVTISENVTVKSLTIEEGSNVTLIVNGQLTVGDGASEARSTYGDLYVKDSAKVILSAGGDLKVRNLFIEATLGNLTQPGSSGQISRKDVLTVNGDVYFKLSLEPNKAPVTKGWYDFVVPFEVDVIGGITIADAPTAQMVFNTNYAVMNYDEEKRATNGKSWNKFTGTMVPGKVYTIAIDYTKGWKTVLFKKKKGAAIDDNTSLATSYSNVGETIDRGWNGLGNSTLQHCQLNLAGISDDSKNNPKIQVYDHSNDLYVTLEASSYSCAIGTSFFVQVPQKVKSISLSAIEVQNRGGIFFAPAYEDKTINEFRLALTMEGKQIASDHLWVSASEAATGEYVIGQDLGKMGDLTSAKIARMWAKNNDMSLCDIEMPLVYGEASCALNIFAPEQATYTLSIEEAPEDAELYLTYNGKVIWNLTASPSQLVLKKGVKEGYGLLIKSAKESDRPEGFEDINTEDGVVRKVLIDNKIYIITPNGSMYDVAGKLVR